MNRNLATLVLLSTFIGFAADGQLVPPAVVPGTALPKAAPPALIAPAISPLTPAPIAPAAKPEEPSVNWQGLYRQSALFLGVEHAFRLATEAGTRGAKGPFLQGYVNSVSNLHGWSDGDPFYVNYIGHPMQGSVAGYIWAQNDRRYASVKFGKNSTYWKSRLRATGYAWAYSTLFEIGPLSEASIGYIQSKHPQQGLVDHVVTPVIGLGWMVGEDAIDRYLLTGLEQRVRNTYVRAFARSFLNPTRSMANLMAFRVPFYRDGRSIFTEKSQVRSISTEEPDEQIREDDGPAPLEVTAIYSGYRLGSSRSCTGGGAEAAFRLASDWQLVLDVHGCELGGLPANVSGDSLFYLIGPRWTPSDKRWRPYAQFLVGGTKLSTEQVYPEKRQALIEQSGKELTGTMRDEYATSDSSNGFAMSAGMGVDLKLGPAAALKLASLEYTRSWNSPQHGSDYGRGLQLKLGVTLRMGMW